MRFVGRRSGLVVAIPHLMRLHEMTDLDVGDTTARYEPYAPEPIAHEVTEIIHRLEPAYDDDADEPPPLPPVPARGSRTYPVVTLYPRFR
jgi:hypothetical protein